MRRLITKEDRAATRQACIPHGAIKVSPKGVAMQFYLYETVDRPCAMCFKGSAARPAWRFYFRSIAERDKRIQATIEACKARDAAHKKRHNERKGWVNTYKVGDIFGTCWGYDQTNREYFEVIEVKGKFLILRELVQETVETGWHTGKCVPLPGQFLSPRYKGDDRGLPIRRLAGPNGVKIDECRFGSLIQGETVAGVRVIAPEYWSATH